MHIPCQIRKAHESGNSRTNREEVPPRWSESLQVGSGGGASRPSGWSDSPHPPRPTGSPPRLARPQWAGSPATVRCSPHRVFPSPSPAAAREPVILGSPWLTAKPSSAESASEAGSGCLPRSRWLDPSRLLTGLTRWRQSASIPEPLTEPGQFGRGQGCDEAVEAIGFVINCTGFCTARAGRVRYTLESAVPLKPRGGISTAVSFAIAGDTAVSFPDAGTRRVP
jgi:hypothetical protein